VRQLNNEITAKRNVNFFAFSLVKAEGVEFQNSRESQVKWRKPSFVEIQDGDKRKSVRSGK
jgi:DNA ligase (NAD+)